MRSNKKLPVSVKSGLQRANKAKHLILAAILSLGVGAVPLSASASDFELNGGGVTSKC